MTTQNTPVNDRIKNIIRYNVSRTYFGDWTPDELSNCYLSETPIPLYIGLMSIDNICDALWNEMSYNPVRFGTKNPFEFNGKKSLEKFIDTPIAPDNKAFITLLMIQSYLSNFWNLATKYDENFRKRRFLKGNCVIITKTMPTNPTSKPVPSVTYIMLKYLRKSIKQIASQNLSDIAKKTYQQPMIDTILAKHPNLLRLNKVRNFTVTENHIDTKLQKYKHDESCLINAIWNKSSEILDTESRINTLNNEFENPGDISNDEALLEKQNADLQRLEYALAGLRQQMKEFIK